MRPTRRSAWAARASLGAAALLFAGGVVMSACSNGGTALAKQACVHVDDSITLFTRAEHETNQATAAQTARRARTELERAEPLAAEATSQNPAYNPLMTTLQEIGRTSEANLIPALDAQCAAVTNPTSQSPVGGSPSMGTTSGRVTTGR